MLIHSKDDTESGKPCRIVLIPGDSDSDSAAESTDEEAVESEEDEDVSEREAEYIACEIERLLREEKKNNGEPIRPRDIAILMRSVRSSSGSSVAASFDAE